MYQFQLPSTSSSAKFPGVDGIKLYLVSKQIRPVFMRFTTAKSAFLQVDGSFISPFDHRKNTLLIGTLAPRKPKRPILVGRLLN